MIKMTLFALAIAGSGLLITPTVAQAPETRIVALADLDLETAAGRNALDTRIARAAIELCGWASDGDLAGGNDIRACRDRAIAGAQAQVEQRLASHRAAPIVLAAR
jgi:UrcA family protein